MVFYKHYPDKVTTKASDIIRDVIRTPDTSDQFLGSTSELISKCIMLSGDDSSDAADLDMLAAGAISWQGCSA